MGERARPQATARRRRDDAHRPVAAAQPLQGTHDRAAGEPDQRAEGQRRSARAQRDPRARHGQGPGARARPRFDREEAEGAGVQHQARLPVLRHEFLRARSAPVLVQLQTRLVRGLLRHRPRARGLRRGTERRGERVERLARRRSAHLRDLRRAAAQPDRAARALPRPQHRRSHAPGHRRNRVRSSASCASTSARPRSRAT